MKKFVGYIFCLIGLHDYEIIDSIVGFGSGGGVSKVKCRRCKHVTTKNFKT